jgi:hypothetical protein
MIVGDLIYFISSVRLYNSIGKDYDDYDISNFTIFQNYGIFLIVGRKPSIIRFQSLYKLLFNNKIYIASSSAMEYARKINVVTDW